MTQPGQHVAQQFKHEGIVIKTMGDALLAMFNFPMKRDDHVRQSVMAARDLQANWARRRETLNEDCRDVGIGVGLDCGEVSFGEFGRAHQDLTAIGTVVNRAARAQAEAGPGEILVTEAVRERCRLDLATAGAKEFALKGFDAPTRLWAA